MQELPEPEPPRTRGALRWVGRLVAGFMVLSLGFVVLYRVVPIPLTPLMLLRAAQGYPIRHQWLDRTVIPPVIEEAVIASEDQRFCAHHGFDFVEINRAWADHEDGLKLRGASTISQQAARNLFLLPMRSFVRKGAEAYFTVAIEFLWPKSRIIEAYLNSIEWGPGVYGIEAASQYAFHHPAARLSRMEAALLTAILPNPLRWSASEPTAYIRDRADEIVGRMARHEADTACVSGR